MTTPGSSEKPGIDSILLGFIAWLLGLVGAIIVLLVLLLTRRKDRYARFWVAQSISFFVIALIVYLISLVIGVVPAVGDIVALILRLAIFVIWLIGIYYSITGQYKRPPVVGIVSEKLEPVLPG
ncbi:MAG: hypothetical protein QXS85_01920 [Acidilobaceae archaeon]